MKQTNELIHGQYYEFDYVAYTNMADSAVGCYNSNYDNLYVSWDKSIKASECLNLYRLERCSNKIILKGDK